MKHRKALFNTGLIIFIVMIAFFFFIRIAQMNYWFGLSDEQMFQWAPELLAIPILLMVLNRDYKPNDPVEKPKENEENKEK